MKQEQLAVFVEEANDNIKWLPEVSTTRVTSLKYRLIENLHDHHWLAVPWSPSVLQSFLPLHELPR